MIGRALDSNNDLLISEGRFRVVQDAPEIIQHVRTRLQFYLEEWFLNLNSGTPYFQQIFTKPVNLANIESILKVRILETEGILKLTEFSMTYEGGSSRQLSVSFSAETTSGTIDNNEVTINV
tara:strand:- start:653 stop:1018 length:366 start_codon:yes stop_codon:yes gene_type:complete